MTSALVFFNDIFRQQPCLLNCKNGAGLCSEKPILIQAVRQKLIIFLPKKAKSAFTKAK